MGILSAYVKLCEFEFYRRRGYHDASTSSAQVYLFGIIDGGTKISEIYTYAERHLRDWFPNLPSYTAFDQRLNKVADVFAPFVEKMVEEQNFSSCAEAWLMDSFPVALAKQGHRFKARVAPEIADAGYCSTKKLYYYGIRVHVIGRSQPGTLPLPEYIGVTGASHHEGKIFEQIRPVLFGKELYADKAYILPDARDIATKQGLTVYTPVKKTKGTSSPGCRR